MPDETVYPSNKDNGTPSPQTSPYSTTDIDRPIAPYNYGAESDNPRPELTAEPFDKRPLWYGIGVAVAFILIVLGIGILLYLNPPIASVVRDIFIIYMGVGIFLLILLLIVLTVVLIYLVLKLNDLTQLLRREVIPVLTNVQSSVKTVRGTTSFISEQAVKPVIHTASTVAAVNAIFKSLFRRN